MAPWFPGEAVLKQRNAKGRAAEGGPPLVRALRSAAGYFTSTVAPSSSSWLLALSATSLATRSSTGAGALSTRSLASLRPRLVIARTALMTLIFLSPMAVRTTSNSVCSSTGSAPPPVPGAAIMTGAAAAAVTSNVSSNCLMKSDSSRSVISLKLSSRSSVLTLAIVYSSSFCASFASAGASSLVSAGASVAAASAGAPATASSAGASAAVSSVEASPDVSSAGVSSAGASAAASCADASAGASDAASAGSFSLYASSSDRNFDCVATNTAAARDISDFSIPAILDNITSRLSRSASAPAVSASSGAPSM